MPEKCHLTGVQSVDLMVERLRVVSVVLTLRGSWGQSLSAPCAGTQECGGMWTTYCS